MSKQDFDNLKNLENRNGEKVYFSRTKYGYCKNKGCYNKRRANSAYCQECSDNNN